MIMVPPKQFRLLDRSLRRVVDARLPLATHFYGRLFAAHPALRPLFPTDLTAQQRKFEDMLVVLVSGLTVPDGVAGALRQLAVSHIGYGAKPEHYPVVAEVLMDSLRTLPGAGLLPEELGAWSGLLDTMVYVLVEETRAAMT
ncbi:globin domain-containing protein [Jannaschia aquimarina]|uniref:Vhb protein n=1 Tax=Jannaschia aquimarina TaxID=935700 RepID=A0A0D1EGS4_9RHOB|nr:globin domain-containing protein [Jannaschia aquimarina]KIT15055.1 Bacterial hemoglobin [Jannaschia aquimarina]SNS62941.1 nitric oxide dioxygenase [Jannaschia aquimarina]